MDADITPGSHWRTPTGKRLRIVTITGPNVSAVYTTPSGIDYRTADAQVSLSVEFLRRWCRPVQALAVEA